MKILIIEDNPKILNALKQGFKYKGVITEQCSDGLKAINMLKKNFYDLAIVDLGIPKKDGEAVVREAQNSLVSTPLLVLTARHDAETKARLLNLGVDDYMGKPYYFDELYARVMAILRRAGHGFPSEYLKTGNLELIPERRIAVRQGKEIQLRGKEYDLLKYFMCHLDIVMSRQLLMEKVWGYSATVFTNTVDAHVSNLRSKIDRDFDEKLIKTVHGVGYVMNSAKS